MNFLVHTDFGHDSDDAIALAYLIEHGYIPHTIGITPGFFQQNLALCGLLQSYDVTIQQYYTSEVGKVSDTFNHGKHKMFDAKEILYPHCTNWIFDKVLIIGPAKNIGHKVKCEELFFQGGYSPNSVASLAKFEGVQAVQSFNPSGAKTDFNKLLESPDIKHKYYIGKNVCHGFTKHHLQKMWKPKNELVKKFWNQLTEYKAMHDVLAAMIFIDKDFGIWEQAKPTWVGNKMTTTTTTEEIYSLIGINV